MKTTSTAPRPRAGFTLVELIGVLAIVATLASLLLPQVLGSISRSRVMDTVGCYHSIKAGAITYAYRHGYFGDELGRPLDVTLSTNQATAWDREVLLKLKLIDEVFRSRIGTSAHVQVRNTAPAASAPDGTNPAYNLAGDASNPNQAAGARHVLEVRLTDVLIEDARELNRSLDGEGNSLGETAPGTDLRGRVKYDFSGNESPGFGDVYLYLTHL
jgi:prepilin-type N-terminal cleavage/methylation domain-containing protein